MPLLVFSFWKKFVLLLLIHNIDTFYRNYNFTIFLILLTINKWKNLYIDNIEKQYIDIFLISATNWINVNPWVSADVQINLQTDLTKSSATS